MPAGLQISQAHDETAEATSQLIRGQGRRIWLFLLVIATAVRLRPCWYTRGGEDRDILAFIDHRKRRLQPSPQNAPPTVGRPLRTGDGGHVA